MEQRNIQWFPGHMTRTRRRIIDRLPLVDLVVEIIDARIPISSRNPDLGSIVKGKPRLVVLNKIDIADEAATKAWLAHFAQRKIPALAVDCKSGRGIAKFVPLLREILKDKIATWEQRGMTHRAIRVMVVGIPNCGKSSFINRMAKGGKAKAEDRPGVTRDQQWFVIDGGAQLLDTPGVLWPKFEDQAVAQRLAYTGAIRDEVLDSEELACGLLEILHTRYETMLRARYKLTGELPEDPYDLLQLIGRKRGMLISGGEVNTERAAIMLLDEFPGGELGGITLEMPR